MSDLNKIRLLLADPLMVQSEITLFERQQWKPSSQVTEDESTELLLEACLVNEGAFFVGDHDLFGVDVFSHDE